MVDCGEILITGKEIEEAKIVGIFVLIVALSSLEISYCGGYRQATPQSDLLVRQVVEYFLVCFFKFVFQVPKSLGDDRHLNESLHGGARLSARII